jgi:hypothetical protein
MKIKSIITTFVLSIIIMIFNVSAKNEGSSSGRQDTPKLDSAKRNNKHGKRLKQNKDSIRRIKKDTV